MLTWRHCGSAQKLSRTHNRSREIMDIKITIDGKQVIGKDRQTVLEVARANNISIPTLCYHEAVPSWGRCRLCVVEVTAKDGSSRVVPSCIFPVKEGLVVSTNSPLVLENRKKALAVLLARAPGSQLIKKLAMEYGIATAKQNKGEKCIVCGLCMRLCAEQGIYTISAVDRGAAKDVNPFLKEPPVNCIGCLICAKNCPTEAIAFEEKNGKRKIWGRVFELVRCSDCGEFTKLTSAQAVFYAKKSGLSEDYFKKCDKCSRLETAMTFMRIIQDPSADIVEKWGVAPLTPSHMPEPTDEWKKLNRKKTAESKPLKKASTDEEIDNKCL